jgi:hypothetical protein
MTNGHGKTALNVQLAIFVHHLVLNIPFFALRELFAMFLDGQPRLPFVLQDTIAGKVLKQLIGTQKVSSNLMLVQKVHTV